MKRLNTSKVLPIKPWPDPPPVSKSSLRSDLLNIDKIAITTDKSPHAYRWNVWFDNINLGKELHICKFNFSADVNVDEPKLDLYVLSHFYKQSVKRIEELNFGHFVKLIPLADDKPEEE